MLDGIVEQLEYVITFPWVLTVLSDILEHREAQEHGIWAWDVQFDEPVLVIPAVLALLGDNPMQSEFACHIGLWGKLFCRACWVKGTPEADPDAGRSHSKSPGPQHNKENDEGEVSDAPSNVGTATSADESSTEDLPAGKKGKGRKKKAVESMVQMVDHVKSFMQVASHFIIPLL
jgi:hypothetical protein